jgi:hypothetical protein
MSLMTRWRVAIATRFPAGHASRETATSPESENSNTRDKKLAAHMLEAENLMNSVLLPVEPHN